MRSAMATPKTPTQLLLTRIPDSWAWMRPDLVIRLLPFTAAFVIAYVLSGRGRWLGVGLGNLTAQVSFAAAAVPLMFAAAVAVQLWLTRRRGALSVPAGADDAWFQAAFYAVNGPIEEAFFRGLVQGALRSEEHTSELQSHSDLVCRLLLEKKKNRNKKKRHMT